MCSKTWADLRCFLNEVFNVIVCKLIIDTFVNILKKAKSVQGSICANAILLTFRFVHSSKYWEDAAIGSVEFLMNFLCCYLVKIIGWVIDTVLLVRCCVLVDPFLGQLLCCLNIHENIDVLAPFYKVIWGIQLLG